MVFFDHPGQALNPKGLAGCVFDLNHPVRIENQDAAARNGFLLSQVPNLFVNAEGGTVLLQEASCLS